jgi:hypothetical protein
MHWLILLIQFYLSLDICAMLHVLLAAHLQIYSTRLQGRVELAKIGISKIVNCLLFGQSRKYPHIPHAGNWKLAYLPHQNPCTFIAIIRRHKFSCTSRDILSFLCVCWGVSIISGNYNIYRIY